MMEEKPVATVSTATTVSDQSNTSADKDISKLLGFQEGDLPSEPEAWEVKAENEEKEKEDEMRKSLALAGFSAAELDGILAEEESEIWEKKADQEHAERQSEIVGTLKFLGLDTTDLDVDNLEEEAWEKKVQVEKPLDDAYVAEHPPPPKKDSVFSGIFTFFSVRNHHRLQIVR
mmetsp:Transcript_3396/g.5288  ORF Transcript_3396/g.5288 Transcript_3396/m.5288 type:complete len:174 (+) Transcript_3396:63-584(+)